MWFLYVAVSLLAVSVAYLAWFCVQLLKQNGRALARIASLEKRIDGVPLANPAAKSALPEEDDDNFVVPKASPGSKHPSLAIGDTAPEFSLPDLAGKVHTFSEWQGRPILLIFSSANCGFCTEMGPDLAAIDISDPRSLLPIVVTNGSAAENQEWVGQHGLQFPVLLQDKMEIANRYLASGTPMGYLVDSQGRIASEIAVGSGSLLDLAEPANSSISGPARNGNNGHVAGKTRRSVAESRIPRDGLPAGTTAPDFTLPMLDGREISLSKYRGGKVLIVFSDPQCGPCLALDPILEQRHKSRPDVSILMVSRGSVDANKEMVAEHGLTFPLVLQHKWEISKLYAMFATPIGYLIDENGVIEADIGVGADEILALLTKTENAAQKEVVSGRI